MKTRFPTITAATVLSLLVASFMMLPTSQSDAATLASLGKKSGKAKTGLFGRKEIRGGSLSKLPKWYNVVKKMKRQKAILLACAQNKPSCPAATKAKWRKVIRKGRSLSKAKQIKFVHRYFNAWPYKFDHINYKKRDYWATPMEFMRRSGDCEDYSIIKFYALKQLGFRNSDMRVVAVVDRIRRRGHANLAVKYKGKTVILDNTSQLVDVHTKYKPLYMAHYSVNETTRWSHLPK